MCAYLISAMNLWLTDHFCFTEEFTEALKASVTCSRSLNIKEANPGFELVSQNLCGFLFLKLILHNVPFGVIRLDWPIRVASFNPQIKTKQNKNTTEAIFNKDRPRDYHRDYPKSDGERRMSYDITCIWNLKK